MPGTFVGGTAATETGDFSDYDSCLSVVDWPGTGRVSCSVRRTDTL